MRLVIGISSRAMLSQAKPRKKRLFAGIADASFVDGYREKISYYYKRQGSTVYKEVVFFLMESKTTDVKLSFEHIGYSWLPYEATMEKLTFKNARDVLQKAQTFLNKQGITK
jgi:bis(5'-nucleosidyl)-tetraphosphatase